MIPAAEIQRNVKVYSLAAGSVPCRSSRAPEHVAANAEMRDSVFFADRSHQLQDPCEFLQNHDFENMLGMKSHTTVPAIKKVIVPKSTDVLSKSDFRSICTASLRSNEKFALQSVRGRVERKSIDDFYATASPLNRSTWNLMKTLNIDSRKFLNQFIKTRHSKILLNGTRGGDVQSINLSALNFKKGLQKTPPKKSMQKICGGGEKWRTIRKRVAKSSSRRCLFVRPQVGVGLKSICRFLKLIRPPDGTIDSNWAKFATSLVGRDDSSTMEHKFILPSEPSPRNRTKIVEPITYETVGRLKYLDFYTTKDYVEQNVKLILKNLLQTVHINSVQDVISTPDPDDRQIQESDALVDTDYLKPKRRKCITEIEKLEINVVDLDSQNRCQKNDFCRLGCVCFSLSNSVNLNEQNKKLNIEGKKIRSTVYKINNETVTLGSKRRGVGMPKRYEDCSLDTPIAKADAKRKALNSNTSVQLTKLPECLSFEPWCMVHCLYKCFCKGLHVEGDPFPYSTFDSLNKTPPQRSDSDSAKIVSNTTEKGSLESDDNKSAIIIVLDDMEDSSANESSIKSSLKSNVHENAITIVPDENDVKLANESSANVKKISESQVDLEVDTCSRTSVQERRVKDATIQKIDFKSGKSILNQSKGRATNKPHFNILTKIKYDVFDTVKNPDQYKFSEEIYKPVPNECAIVHYKTLMGALLLEKIFLYVTEHAPFRVFITFSRKKDLRVKCVDLFSASDRLRGRYPAYIDYVYNRKNTNTYLFLENELTFSDVWSIVASSTVEERNESNATTPPGPVIVSAVSLRRPDRTSESPPLKTPNQTAPNHWFEVMIGNDFEKIEVPSKNFTAHYVDLVKMMSLSNYGNQILNLSSDDMRFGAFALPMHVGRKIYFGPYADCRDPDIVFKKREREGKVKSWGLWVRPDANLAKYFNAKVCVGSCVDIPVSQVRHGGGDEWRKICPATGERGGKQGVVLFEGLVGNGHVGTLNFKAVDVPIGKCKERIMEDDDEDVIIVPNDNPILEISDSE